VSDIIKPDPNPTIVPEFETKQIDNGKSKFLKFQDQNGDNLPDVCDVEIAPAENVCKDCIPNPKAISRDWTKTNQDNPFLNEKICKYQVTFVTDEKSTGFVEGMTEEESNTALREIYEKYARDAAVALVRGFQKDDSEGIIAEVVNALEYTSFDLNYRNNSRLKLLYSVDFQQIFSLPDEEPATDEEEEDKPSDIEVSYNASEMVATNIVVRKGLNLFGRFAKVARAVEGKIIRFEESNKVFNFENYGDSAIFTKKSPVGDLLRELDKWLNSRGYNISNIGAGFGKENVIKLDFVFTGKYKLKKLKVYTVGCGSERPDMVYGKKYVQSLNRTDAWKDPTAVAYFAKMKEIENDVTARQPMPFEEFVVKHTYPKVFVQGANDQGDVGAPIPKTIDCIGDALKEDAKELGQDIFDEVFSIADAVAYRFHKNLCQTDPSKVNEDAILQGLNLTGNRPSDPSNVYSLAKVQAFDTINAEDSAFAQICFRMISMGASGVECGLSPLQQLDQMYAQGLDRIAVCGLMDLLLEAMQCLFKGLTLEQALASILRSALKAMGVQEIGELFVGLPKEKRDELERIVNQKLERGDIFSQGSPGQASSDAQSGVNLAPTGVALSNLKGKKPWNDKKFVEESNSNKRADNYGNMKASPPPYNSSSKQKERRTIGQKLQAPLGDNYQSNNIILNAYIEAFMEAYQDDYLSLLDMLNRFPGAQLIASIIALLDCPTPPLFNPGFDDFFKSLQLPFCRNVKPITFPRWENPFLYIPKLTDILAAIFEALKKLVLCIIMRVTILILAKICEIIGDAICKALETAGQIGAGLISGNANVREIIRETICGPDASDETIDDTILGLMENFGVGGAAFADPERTISLFGDFINSSNREESLTMFLDGPSPDQVEILDGLLDTDYQEFRGALPNKSSIEQMINNIGNVIPAATQQELRDALSMVSDELALPMNPTLCATEESLADYEALRCDLLEGRMSPEQCKEQNRRARDQILENLNDLGQVLNEGIGSALENSMPPIFSDPACENGLLPFEPEESIKTTTGALKGDMESLKIAFTDDMLGNGGLFGSDDDWGFFNMVLSDTMANPYTAHQRKVYNTNRFVDFYIPNQFEDENDDVLSVSKIKAQRGAYPYYVAEWLKYQFANIEGANDLNINFVSKNSPSEKEVFKRTFKDLGFDGIFDTDVNLTDIQDFGYNVSFVVDYPNSMVEVTRAARKRNPDITLKFKDNAKGYRPSTGDYSYGFDLKTYYSDIQEVDSLGRQGMYNLPNDNIRIEIEDAINTEAKSSSSVEEKLDKGEEDVTDVSENTGDILRYRKYEFFAIDDTLDNVNVNESTYPNLFETFYGLRKPKSPQVYALMDLTGLGESTCNTLYDSINTDLYNIIRQTVADNEDESGAWLYGAEFDDLTSADFDYGIELTAEYAPYQDPLGGYTEGDFILYENFRLPEYDDEGRRIDGSSRPVNNTDTLLGISRDAFNNKSKPDNIRITYLDPSQFGQTYLSPSLYIKPLTNKGWLGAVNLMFPEYTPCKPRDTNLIAFDDIQSRIDNAYPRIPEDERLKSDPDCISEVPFNRILTRPGRAGLEGLITALIRIFASTHFMKSLPVFINFEPKFPENYSNIYASYIIETMEEACKASGGNFLSPFKDDEFWYAFLEQSVQLYSRRLDDDLDESITPDNVPLAVQNAIEKINQLQENYDYPDKKDLINAPPEEKSNFQTLKSYREEKNLEAIQQVEEDAKIILLELVKEQLSFISDLFRDNLKKSGFKSQVVETDYYFLQNLVAGAQNLKLQNAVSFVEQVDNTELEAAIENGSGYTTGNLFALPSGKPYVGDYHVHIDENGNQVFMVGEYHISEPHDVLVPFANNVVVRAKNNDGDIISDSFGDVDTTVSFASDKKFYLKKYVLIENTEYSVSEAETLIRNLKVGNISDYYPGTFEFVNNDEGRPVGVDGDLDVQHVLEFGMLNDDSKIEITRVTLNALDLPVSEYVGPRANSKLLLCLLDNLRDDQKFRLIVDYIFSMKKALSVVAIYTDMAFLPSIGEFTVSKKDMFSGDIFEKPGVRVSSLGVPNYTPGWANEKDRNKLFASPFFKKWDEWDQILLRKSVRRAKKIFRPYYRKRKFEVEDLSGPGSGDQFLNTVKKRFTPLPGGQAIPWWKRRKIRPNPYNSKGQLCKKQD